MLCFTHKHTPERLRWAAVLRCCGLISCHNPTFAPRLAHDRHPLHFLTATDRLTLSSLIMRILCYGGSVLGSLALAPRISGSVLSGWLATESGVPGSIWFR